MCNYCEPKGWHKMTCNFCGINGYDPYIVINIRDRRESDYPYQSYAYCKKCFNKYGLPDLTFSKFIKSLPKD